MPNEPSAAPERIWSLPMLHMVVILALCTEGKDSGEKVEANPLLSLSFASSALLFSLLKTCFDLFVKPKSSKYCKALIKD